MFKFFDVEEFHDFLNNDDTNFLHKIITDNIFYNDWRIVTDVHKCELEYIKDGPNVNIKIHTYKLIISDIYDFGYHINTFDKMKSSANTYHGLNKCINLLEKEEIIYPIKKINDVLDILLNIKVGTDYDNEIARIYITFILDEVFGDKYKKN